MLTNQLPAIPTSYPCTPQVRVTCEPEGVDDLAATLEQAADCVAVHRIGSTVTLFRDRSLPALPAAAAGDAHPASQPAESASSSHWAPSAAQKERRGAGAAAAADAAGASGDAEEEGSSDGEDEESEENGEEEEDSEDEAEAAAEFYEVAVGDGPAARQERRQKPPEFTVIG